MMSFIVQANAIDFEEIKKQVGTIVPSLKPEFKPGTNISGPLPPGETRTTAEKVGMIISTILPYLFIIAGLLLFFYLIAAGFQMMTSPGDEKAVASAKAKITSAIAGFLILFVSFWLVKLLGYILGLELL